jgi:heptosyltransferase-2
VIAVRLPNWLGDTVMALPALAELRARRPGERIAAIGRWAPLLLGQGVADLELPYPRGASERLAFGRSLARERPEMAIVLPNSLESALAACWWRAERRVGFDADGRGALLTDAVPLPWPRRHQIDEYAALLAALSIEVTNGSVPRWNLPERSATRERAEALLTEAGLPAQSRLAGLHVGAALGSSKLWAAESFAQLALRLERAGMTPLLLGAPGDEDMARAVTAAAPAPVASLVGRDSSETLPWILARLACLVSGDTGVAHLAAALGVPTVTLFGPTDPGLSAPRGARARVLSGTAPCAPCFLATCPIDHICLRSIAVEAVACAALEAVGE